MTGEQFKNQLDKLQEVITRGLAHYTVWKKLRLHDPDRVEWSLEQQNQILGRFRGFFTPVAVALLDMALIEFVKVFDPDPRTASLENLLKAGQRDANLVPGASPNDLRKISGDIRQYNLLLTSLKRKRSQQLVHVDANPDPVDPILTADFDKLADWVKSAFNTLATGHDQSYVSWEYLLQTSERQTTEVFGILLEDMARQLQEYEEKMVRIGLDEARRAETMLGQRLDKESLGSVIGTLGLTKELMQRVEKAYGGDAQRSVPS